MHHNVDLGVGSGAPDVPRHHLDVVHNAWRVCRFGGYSYTRIQSETPASRSTSHTLRWIIVSHEGTDDLIDRGASHLAETEKTIWFFFLSASVGVSLNDAYRLCLTEPFS